MSSSVVVPVEVEDIVLSDGHLAAEGFHRDLEVYKSSYVQS